MHRFHALYRLMKGDVRHLPLIVKSSIVSLAIYFFGWGFADPFFSLYLNRFASHYEMIGWFHTVLMVAAIIILFPLGDLLDRARRSQIVNGAKFGYFFVGLSYFLAGQFHSIPLLIVALLINGLLLPLVWAGTSSIIRAHSDDTDAGLASGIFLTAQQVAWAGGLALALLLIERVPIHYIFIPVMIFPLVSILFQRREAGSFEPLHHATVDIIKRDKLILRFLRECRTFSLELWCTYGLMFFSYTLYVIAFIYLPLYAASLGFSLIEIGALVLALNTPFLLSVFAAEVADHLERLGNVVIGFSVSCIAFALLAFFHQHDWQLFVFGFLIVAGYSIINPSLNAIVSLLSPKKYAGTATAATFIVAYVSAVIFSPLIGGVIDASGWYRFFSMAAIVCGLFVIIAAGIRLLFLRRNVLYRVNHPDSKHDPYII